MPHLFPSRPGLSASGTRISLEQVRRRPLLACPVLVSARKSSSTTMVLATASLEEADWVEVRIGSMPGVWQSAGNFQPGPEICVQGLTPGMEYRVEVRAGASVGVSSWSEQITCR